MEKDAYYSILLSLTMLISKLVYSPVCSLTDFCSEPIGLETKVISDKFLESEWSESGMGPENARLNNKKAWCASKNGINHVYLQIDLGQNMGIKKIAYQGDPANSANFVKKFRIMYKSSGGSYISVLKNDGNQDMIFSAQNITNNTCVHEFPNFLLSARYLRIFPVEISGTLICMRLELYGCPQVCSPGLGFEYSGNMPLGSLMSSSTSSSGKNASMALLNGPDGWCSSKKDSSQYLQIDLGKVMLISGIASQGVSNSSVNNFTIEFGDTIQDLIAYKSGGSDQIFLGNKDGNTVVMNWLSPPIESRYLKIRPVHWTEEICMRIELTGCREASIRPIGLEKKVVSSAAFTSSSTNTVVNTLNENRHAYQARLNNENAWCGAKEGNSFIGKEWLAINLGNTKTVTGISTQGDPDWATNFLKEFYIEFSFDNVNWKKVKKENNYVEKIFSGNHNNIATVSNLFPNEGVSAKHIRIKAKSFSGLHQCVRLELYGSPQYCTTSLGLKLGTRTPPGLNVSSNVNTAWPIGMLLSQRAWCSLLPNKGSLYVTFQSEITAHGVALQGNPSSDNWITKFKVKYGVPGNLKTLQQGNLELYFELLGDRDSIVYIWFPHPIVTKTIEIIPVGYKKWICFRMDILGCDTGCFQKLGLESGSLTDITASSALTSNTVAANSRLNSFGKSWVSCRNASSCHLGPKETSKEWIQVCFDKMQTISGIIVQGGGDISTDKVKTFSLLYKYKSDGDMFEYKESAATKIFRPNPSRYGTVFVRLPIALTARCLRLKVEGYHGQNAALRWEVLGCDKVGLPLLSVVDPVSVKKNATAVIKVKTIGQPGIKIQWFTKDTLLKQALFKKEIKTNSYGSLLGKVEEEFVVRASLAGFGSYFENCILQNASLGHYNCLIPLTCSASYGGVSTKQNKTFNLQVKEINLKASKPRLIQLLSVKAKTVSLNWTAPADLSDFDFKHYKLTLYYKRIAVETQTSLITNHTWADLSPSTNYNITISYVNKMNAASQEARVQFITQKLPCGAAGHSSHAGIILTLIAMSISFLLE